MRRELCIVALICLAGCHAHTHQPTTQVAVQAAFQTTVESTEPKFDDAAPAAALVFAPPIAPADGELDLDRASRERTAFLGYEDLVREYIYIRTDDRFSADGNDRYERRAITERVGSLTR